MSSILVVDDQRSAREYLRLLLENEGHDVRSAENGVEALVLLEREPADCVVSDLDMPEMDGIELLSHLSRRWKGVPVVVLTAASEVEQVVEAVRLGATNYLVKPASASALTDAVSKALVLRPPSEGDVAAEIPEIIGSSRAIVEVRSRVAMAARSDVPVLISGPTGTGKELIANAIHRHSSLSKRPFVPTNCAAIPRELFESTFFGHRRGSFTGADRDHAGLLVEADNGILFLDELEALSLEHQAKLLRVLDDGEVRPIGGTSSRRVSVRFVAATNRDTGEMIEAKELREDLYFRICGFEIHLPPLAERAEDIPTLAQHFLPQDAAGFSAEAMRLLSEAPWPGNVRQLRNAVRSAAAAAGNGPIAAEHLPPELASSGPVSSERSREAEPTESEAGLSGLTLKEIERRAIVQALEDSEGNRSAAARRLDIDRSTLRRKMAEYEIED